MLDPTLIRQKLESKIRLIIELGKQENILEGYRISIQVTEAIYFYRRYWGIDYSELYPTLIAAQHTYQLMVMMVARQLADAEMKEAAAFVAATAVAFNVPGNTFPLFLASALRKVGDLRAARAIAQNLLELKPDDGYAFSEIAQCEVAERFLPMDYYDVLNCIHTQLNPKAYVEIGVAQGRSLALVRVGTTSVGIDPDTGSYERIIFYSFENDPLLFKMTSDVFFTEYNLLEILGHSTIDVAFLDGLHLFEQTLKDFINIERFAGPDSMILIHDCLPVNGHVATRERSTAFWLGDVWKIIPCLKTIRPDLDIVTLPVKPSGLAVIRNLDPSSRVLERQFNNIVEHFNNLSLPISWEEKCQICCVTDQTPEQLLGLR